MQEVEETIVLDEWPNQQGRGISSDYCIERVGYDLCI